MVLQPPHVGDIGNYYWKMMIMGGNSVKRCCVLDSGQTAYPAGGRGVCPYGVGEIGSDGDSKRSAVSLPRSSAHDPLTH